MDTQKHAVLEWMYINSMKQKIFMHLFLVLTDYSEI